MLEYQKKLKQNSRLLRTNTTNSESFLWSKLRRKQLGLQFYRQKPIGNFIVDFYGPKAKLVIELDGSQHLEENHLWTDKQRDEYLMSQGLQVLRFNNTEVLKNIEGVVETIYKIVMQRSNPKSIII